MEKAALVLNITVAAIALALLMAVTVDWLLPITPEVERIDHYMSDVPWCVNDSSGCSQDFYRLVKDNYCPKCGKIIKPEE